MNRIICDICGSEYPENAERCPICSYPRQGNEKVVAAAGEAVRTKVKGGKFSNKNVKKRRKAQQKAAKAGEENPNKSLWIIIVLLLVAIALVTTYIVLRFIGGQGAFTGSTPAQTSAPATTTAAPTTLPPTVPCEALVLDASVVDLEVLGEQKQLSVMAVPGDTTDLVLYASTDLSVATVSETGLVTATGSGQTTVTITCGTVVQTVTVVCWFPAETTAPVETAAPTQPPETTKATEPPKATAPAELTLDVTDASCFAPNEAFTLNAKFGGKTVSRSKITWSTSDEKIATVDNGVVTAVGKGTATITAEYEGKKAQCIVRCRFEDTSWRASATDVTLGVGESFTLTVTNNSGETADVSWSANAEGIVSVNGKTVTGQAPGTVTLTATVDGVSVTCIVRVK